MLSSLLELIYPETCVGCGAESDERPWFRPGRRVPGLGWTDRPHLCRACGRLLRPGAVPSELPGGGLMAVGGRRTCGDLVAVIAQWKYRGVRGLAWPLAPLLCAAVATATERYGPVDLLVPVPLHRRRRRQRGFNQVEILAHLVGEAAGLPVDAEVLHRTRATGQQAKLKGAQARRRNVRNAFSARSATPGRELCVGLIDDLVTGGATCSEAARALNAAGWRVGWVASLGLAADRAETGEPAAGEAPVDTVVTEI